MYEERFALAGPPFRLNPDPKFFFGSRSHNKAMAYLHYGLRQGEGFIVITGEIGAGKSMLIGRLFDQLDRSNVVAANLVTSSLEPEALLSHILSAFRIEPAGEGKSAELEAFEDYLFDQMNRGRRVLLIVDEAQNLPVRTIEELRMLSNMDYDGTPLFQVFLVGQPEFRAMLARPEMEQLRQRVIASYHLEPLAEDETRDYILHRLAVVGWAERPAIAADAFAAIHAAAAGVPRRINTLCNRLFLHCALEGAATIDAALVAAVAADLAREGAAPEEARAEPVEAAAEIAEAAKAQASGEARRGARIVSFDAVRKLSAAPRAAEPSGAAEKPAPASAPAASSGASSAEGMSVFDRLRARRQKEPAPAAATLDEVASAIAAYAAAPEADAAADADDAPSTDETGGESRDRRSVMLAAVEETQADLKAVHDGVAGVQRLLAAHAERRRAAKARLAEALARAEAMLVEARRDAQ